MLVLFIFFFSFVENCCHIYMKFASFHSLDVQAQLPNLKLWFPTAKYLLFTCTLLTINVHILFGFVFIGIEIFLSCKAVSKYSPLGDLVKQGLMSM